MTLLTLNDYQNAARDRAWPPGVWDFLAGGAGRESTLTGNSAAYGAWRLRPRTCVDVSNIDLTVKVLDWAWGVPIGFAPTALHELCCDAAEAATARAAQAHGVPMVVSTFASRTIEEIAQAAPQACLWQQVYIFRDREVTASLARRAAAAGARAIVVTVDSPWLGRRMRDIANDFRMPATARARNLARSLDTEPDISSPAAHSAATMDPSLTWRDITWLTEVTELPVIVKGIQAGEDAALARDAGAAAVIVSNHGGRQLDRARPTLDVLPEVVAALPDDYPVLMDGGIRSGIDALIALASGANALLIGRPVLHGLAVAGENGARDVLNILTTELADAMGQCGQPRVSALDRTLIEPAPHQPAPHPSTPHPSTLNAAAPLPALAS
jgi:isopentenyl diphosphate isomerase/L-lactate dehydrogenase-like FMN-dependent dehydrogenase